MKKILFAVFATLSLTSCYTTKVYHGDMKPTDPQVSVNSTWNHHIIYGLVPVGNNELKISNYVGDKKNYMVKTQQSFVNGFLEVITLGIYTPTTTTVYLPYENK